MGAKTTSRAKEVILVLTLVVLVAFVSHVVIVYPLALPRLSYHFEAQISQWFTRCSGDAPDWMYQVQRYATRNMGAQASQLAWLSQDSELHHCETGWKDGLLGNEALQPEHRFRIASVTKMLTAAAILDLINEDRLALDDRLVEVLGIKGPFRDPEVADITIEHLLRHRSGWDRIKSQDAMFLPNKKPWCPDNLAYLSKTGVMNQPGKRESYSNLGYCLLGAVLKKMTGQPYRQYMRQKFQFDSLGLGFVDGPYVQSEPAYDFRHENFFSSSYYKMLDFQSLSSSAGLLGSAVGLTQAINLVMRQEPLSIIDGSATHGCEPGAVQSCYGYGTYLYQKAAQPKIFAHDGKLPGATSVVMIAPTGGILVWLGAGVSPNGSEDRPEFYDVIIEKLR
jgi:D-alanyl-D-alanine carboxypeptidase